MDENCSILRKQLDELGYTQSFSLDSKLLIERLTADLLQTTSKLEHYMKLSKEALQQRDSSKCASESYKCDNAKLLKENNKLRLELVHTKEECGQKLKESIVEIKKLKSELRHLQQENSYLKCRCRENEFERISADTVSSSRLIGQANRSHFSQKQKPSVSSFSALDKDCYYQECGQETGALNEESEQVLNKASLNSQLKESLDKQHEAMARALQLANQNSMLEKERNDVDRIALKLKMECNHQLNEKSQLISNLRNQCESQCIKIQQLETELQSVMDTHQKCAACLEMNASEINGLKSALESISQIKQNLVKENNDLLDANRHLYQMHHKSTSDSRQKKTNFVDYVPLFSNTNRFHNEALSKDELMALLEKERQFYTSQINDIKKQLNDKSTLECKYVKDDSVGNISCQKLKEERDFYIKENTKLKISLPSEEFITELQNKICGMEHQIDLLKKQNETLADSNHALSLRIEEGKLNQRKHAISNSQESKNVVEMSLNKLKKELKRAHDDIKCLEEERTLLRDRLKATTETRLDRQIDMTQRDSRYEHLLQETLNTARDKALSFDNMQKECDNLREKLKIAETELMHMKTLHNQHKTLQLETDKNINEAQAQLYESKKEVRELRDALHTLGRCKAENEQEINTVKTESVSLRENLSRIDQDRDKLIMDIDEKTERISSLQHQLRGKDTALEMLENKTIELNRRLELLTGGNSSLEQRVRDLQTHNDVLSLELDNIKKQRDSALIENRRLHSDLAAMNNDLRSVNREYENSRKEVEEMKQQLQHYVDEVRRIEEIFSKKESERTEMLNNFASLSHKATLLESNNHTLKNEVAGKTALLQATASKLSDLEMKLQSRESIVQMQEEKLSNLLHNISKLEIEIEKQKDVTAVADQNLLYVREICATLENQKKSILIGVGETKTEKNNAEFNLRMLNNEKSKLEETTTKDKATIESLESLLNESRGEVIELEMVIQDASDQTRVLKEEVEIFRKRLKMSDGEEQSTRLCCNDVVKQLQELERQINQQCQKANRNEHQILSNKLYPSVKKSKNIMKYIE